MLRTIRGICVFLAAVVLIQGLALLLLTPGGLEKIHPFLVRTHAEKFDPSTNTYVVYYDTRAEIAAADMIVIGIDDGVAESYDILGHFTRFVKQYNNFSTVMLDLSSSQRILTNSLLHQNDESLFERRLQSMREHTDTTVDFTDYFKELFIINRTMTDERKFTLLSFSEKIGNQKVPIEEPTGKDWAAAVAEAYQSAERSVLCTVDSRLLDQHSGFAEALTELLADKNLVFIQTQYDTTTASSETHSTFVFPVTFGKAGIYFVDDASSEMFYSYYNKVTLLPGGERSLADPLDTRYTDYYFVVIGGTAAE